MQNQAPFSRLVLIPSSMSVFHMNPERFLLCIIQGDIYPICLKFEFARRKKLIPDVLSDIFQSEQCDMTNDIAGLGLVTTALGALVERKSEASWKKNANLRNAKIWA